MRKVLLWKVSWLIILLLCFSNLFPKTLAEQVEPIPTSQELYENGNTLSDSEISSIIHEKIQSEQDEIKSHYNPVSVSIAILIVASVAFLIIRWEKKN